MNSATICIIVLLFTSGASNDSIGKSSNLSQLTSSYTSAALPPPRGPLTQDQITDAAPPAREADQPHRLTAAAAQVATATARSGDETTRVTTPAKPTTTPKPVPQNAGSWMVTDAETGLVCIILEMKAELKIEYETKNNSKVSTATIRIPPIANATGSCGDTHQSIALSWKDLSATRSLHLEFQLVNITEVSYIISKLEFKIQENAEQFPNAFDLKVLVVDAVNSTKFLQVQQSYSYACDASRELSLYYITSQATYNATVSFSDMKLEAFRTNSEASFGNPAVCAADSATTNDVVPIAVGCALAALVVIVVIAYLISRKKVRSEYQAM